MRKILLVDDESHVLEALKRQLHGKFEVLTATGAPVALALMLDHKDIEVIVSDMRMPDIDGIGFLEMAQEHCPNAVRMMLTGNADQLTAIEAINRGAIFRFLNKPCETSQFIRAISECGKQHDLIVAEKELLEKTLTGAVRTLIEVLAYAQPQIFGRAQITKQRAGLLADRLGSTDKWAIELAALLSRMGTIVVPPEVLSKAGSGMPLNEREQSLMNRIPSMGAELLQNIPRMERVAQIVSEQAIPFNGLMKPVPKVYGEEITLGGRILKVLNEMSDLEAHGLSPARGLFVMRCKAGEYDPTVLAEAEELFCNDDVEKRGHPIALADLREGMKLRSDLVTAGGSLLVTAGTTITPALMERLRNGVIAQSIEGPIYVDSLLQPKAA